MEIKITQVKPDKLKQKPVDESNLNFGSSWTMKKEKGG